MLQVLPDSPAPPRLEILASYMTASLEFVERSRIAFRATADARKAEIKLLRNQINMAKEYGFDYSIYAVAISAAEKEREAALQAFRDLKADQTRQQHFISKLGALTDAS